MSENKLLEKINEIEEVLNYKGQCLNVEDRKILERELNRLTGQLESVRNKSNKGNVAPSSKRKINKKYLFNDKKHSPGTKSEIKRLSNKRIRLDKEFNFKGSLYKKINKEYYELWY